MWKSKNKKCAPGALRRGDQKVRKSFQINRGTGGDCKAYKKPLLDHGQHVSAMWASFKADDKDEQTAVARFFF